MNTIAIFGDLLYDCFIWSHRLPRVGGTVTGYARAFFASGKGGNQAVVCAKLGAQALMLGKVGRDERGDILLNTMRDNGVNVDGVLVDDEHPTGTDCVMVADGGKNAIVVAPNANAAITGAEVAGMHSYFERAGSALFQLQVNADAVEAASRSLPNYTEQSIRELVNRILDSQEADGYFRDCPITYRDIQYAKTVLIEKLKTIYHTRISYPELKKE